MKASLLLAVALGFTVACNHSDVVLQEVVLPATPSTFRFVVFFQLNPDPASLGAFAPTTVVSLGVHDASALGATLEEATFVVREASGTVVAEARISAPAVIPKGGSAQVSAELVARGGTSPGQLLEIRVVVRDGHGEVHVFTRTVRAGSG